MYYSLNEYKLNLFFYIVMTNNSYNKTKLLYNEDIYLHSSITNLLYFKTVIGIVLLLVQNTTFEM